MTPNAELAYRTLDLINANQAHFKMDTWVDVDYLSDDSPITLDDLTAPPAEAESICRTTACFAGWAVALSGYKLSRHAEVFSGGEVVGQSISGFAAELLGIDDEAAEDLFYVADADIAEAVADHFGPRPVVAS